MFLAISLPDSRFKCLVSLQPPGPTISQGLSFCPENIESSNCGGVTFISKVSTMFIRSFHIHNRHKVALAPSLVNVERSPKVKRHQLEWVEGYFSLLIKWLSSLSLKDTVFTLPPETLLRDSQTIDKVIGLQWIKH